jgi:PAS domain S-box-containing protein
VAAPTPPLALTCICSAEPFLAPANGGKGGKTMSGENKTAFRLLNWVVVLLLLWLCIEAFPLTPALENSAIHQIVHLVLIFFLVVALATLQVIARKDRHSERAALCQEKMELQRTADKTALRYKSLLECAGDAIFVINADTGRLEEMNSRGAELFGYSREEMGMLGGKDLIPMHDQAAFIALVRRVTGQGMAGEASINFKRRDGSRFLGEVNARLIDLGEEKVVQAIVRDITHKRQAEQEIRKRNRKLAILNSIIARANQSLDLHTVLDVTLLETMEVFGAEGGAIHLRQEESGILAPVVRKNLSEICVAATGGLLPAAGNPCQLAVNRQCCNLPGITAILCDVAGVARADGWRSTVGIPLCANKQFIGVMHIMNSADCFYTADDVSFFTTVGNQIGIVVEHARMFAELSRKTSEALRSHGLLEKSSHELALSQSRLKKNLELVERANEELEHLDRMKNHFIGMISHEFRTPLTSILSSAEFLLANRTSATAGEQRRLLEIIHAGGARLNEIVTDLLKVVRLEAKDSTMAKTTLLLKDILEFIQEQLAPVLQERGQRIILQGVDALPFFCGDREFLEEIFGQLLGNAVKFTPDGGEICIAARLADRMQLEEKVELLCRFNRRFYEQMGQKCYLQVEVRDSGIGIEAGEQLKIFDKFYEIGEIRHHSTGKHKFQGKGAGLGLAIVKGMVEAHGGMVWVESSAPDLPGRPGSTFSLLLPMEEGPSQAAFPFMRTDG